MANPSQAGEASHSVDRETLSPTQRGELLRRLRGKSRGLATPRTDRSLPLPLSYGQERVWLHQQQAPHSACYNRPVRIRIQGELNARALEQGLQEILRRHEPLRTIVSLDGDQFRQQIVAAPELSLPFTDLSGETNPVATLGERIEADAERPFDVQQEIPWRLRLYRVSAEEHCLLIVTHHLAFDAWSEGVLFDELCTLYGAFAENRPPQLSELSSSYADYSFRQRAQSESEAFRRDERYWRETLADLPSGEMPTDRPRSNSPSEQGIAVRFEIAAELTDRLRSLGHTCDATLFQTLLTGWAALLSRYHGQADVVIGCPVAGRMRPEFERLIGMFINTLPLRVDVSPETTVREALRACQRSNLAAMEHQSLPLQEIVRTAMLPRGRKESAGFNVLMVYERLTDALRTESQVTFELIPCYQKHALEEILLELTETERGLSGNLCCRAELWEPQSVQRLTERYQLLLEAMAQAPDALLGDLPVLTSQEYRQQMDEWNQTAVTVPFQNCVADIFESQVEQTPDNVAVVCGSEQLTYRELDSRSNQFARHLISLGVGPDGLVGILLERSIELVVAVLATHKAGGAYVPLDPDHPVQRRDQVLADAEPVVVISVKALRPSLPKAMPVVCLDDDGASAVWRGLPTHAPTNAERIAFLQPQHLAYVIYTSGSTGKPKGVMIEHRSLTNHMAWMSKAYPVGEHDRILCRTSASFDASIWEIWLPLISGARLCIAPDEIARDPVRLLRLMNDSGITIAQFVPTLLSTMIEEYEDRPRYLRMVFAGGEPLVRELAQKVLSDWHVPLVNLYGPTEATIQVTHRLCCEPVPDSAIVPIGTPIWNTQVLVLDDRLQPAPIGIPGELFIGGVSLARGYLRQPALTAYRFVPDPFSETPGRRLFRTGDRARWNEHGELEFLGRLDDQVKLRGYRIELGEIEAVLSKADQVRLCSVVLQEDHIGNKRLVAFVVPRGEGTPQSQVDLRAFLALRLPDYMVPGLVVFLDQLPTTASGKVDRGALTLLPSASEDPPNGYVAPQTPLETAVAGIWSDVLGVARVGRDDNFFDLGGHSLAAMRVIIRCRRFIAADVSVKSVFQHPTLANFAAYFGSMTPILPDMTLSNSLASSKISPESSLTADAANHSAGRSPAMSTRAAVENAESFPLSPAQLSAFFNSQLDRRLTVDNINSHWQLQGKLDVESLRRAFETVIARHEPLRTVFGIRNGELLQSVMPASPFALPVHDLRHLSREALLREVEVRTARETATPFDLAQDLLLRAQLLRTADEESVLLLTEHHIASDGYSQQVLWGELNDLYAAYCRDELMPLKDLPCRYADFVAWQHDALQSPRCLESIEYWRGQLEGLPTLELPADRPRPAVMSYRGARLPILLSDELVQQLQNLARKSGTTLHIVLLTVFKVLMARYAEQTDFAVGVPIHGRLKPALETLIGMFVNTLALRVPVEGRLTFRQVLAQVHETCLSAYHHQEVPFQRLIEELHPQRPAGANPLIQVMFQLFNLSDPQMLGDVKITRLPSRFSGSHVDLELTLRPQGDGLCGEFAYSSDLFEAETITRLASHFQTLLNGVVADPDTVVARLPLTTADERFQVLESWNQTEREVPAVSVHRLFERQASLRPDSIALVFGDRQMTYAELNCRANRWAQRLRTLGIGRETRVGISVERSFDMIVGLLAILKAGGGYVPLDPRDPRERSAFLVSDTGASWILTQRHLETRWRDAGVQLLMLDGDVPSTTDDGAENLTEESSPDSLAYVMYTSGSTGISKGVEVLHRGIVRLVCGADYIRLDETQVILQLATLSFDASTFEIWGALLHGARCVLAPPQLPDPVELQQLLNRERIRTLWLTSTLFNAVVDEHPSALQGIEQLLVGGEALSVPRIRRAQQILGPKTQIINGYGPTESTTFACCYQIPHDIPADCTSIPIGKPISNTTAYVLDGAGQPVPIGIPGELHIGGAGVARGYLNRPELTAERFVPHPFSGDPRSRLYRTGDRVRWHSEGYLEFLGRLDEQVKIRGFRIEPGEIEAALRQHPDVTDAVVLAKDDPAVGGRQLVAYLIPSARADRSPGHWRGWLSSRLPAYMIPAHFVELESIPRTSGGKVDRRHLPAPSRTAEHFVESLAPPLSALESTIAEIWRESLQISRVERDDNFFELGGHSLLALRVAVRMSVVLDRTVPVALFFRCPTVSAMAQAVENLEKTTATNVIVELKPGDEGEPLFLFPPIGADLFSSRALVQALKTSRAIYAVDWHAGINPTQRRSLYEISRDCAKHIRTFQFTGPYRLAGYSFGGRLAFETACRLVDAGEHVAFLAIIDAGPGAVPALSWTDSLRGVGRCCKNIPHWIYHDLCNDSAIRIAGRLRRKAIQLWRRLRGRLLPTENLETRIQIEDLFDAGHFPPWFQQRQRADLDAMAQHKPVPYQLKVTLFQAQVRPLFHGHLTDLAWKQMARQGVEVHDIPGHHGTMMRAPAVQDLARKLSAAMDCRVK